MRHTSVVVQMTVAEQVTDSAKKVEAMVRETQERSQTELILFPETCMVEFSCGVIQGLCVETVEALDGPFVSTVRELAARFSIWTVSGFYGRIETANGENRNYDSVLILDDRGEVRGHRRKTHLYDAFGYRESDNCLRDEQLFRLIDSPFGKPGFLVCYELRFPRVAWIMRAGSAEILLMPSAQAKDDLKSEHFRTLLKAHAVENTCYLLAANQHNKVYMGESAAINPVGVVTVNAGKGEAVFPICLDSGRFHEVHKKLPSFKGRQGELYGSLSSSMMNRCQSEV